jgi:polyisoprenoid-binding protein YceI
MRVSASCKLRALAGVLAALLLSACPLRPQAPAAPVAGAPPAAAAETPAPHEGTPYDVVADESLLTIRVYRGGALASAGHNHVIASHALSGTVYVPGDLMRASFELRFPVAELTIDEAALRERENPADFAADVSESARQGTRRNMLSEALLDAERHPQIVLRALRLEVRGDAAREAGAAGGAASVAAREGTALTRVQTTVRGEVRALTFPVSYRLEGDALTASGDATLRQSELGLTPFSAMLGALQVQDEMRVSFRIVARATAPRSK